ncbi:MAG: RNase adapter RapZ [Ilumatobacteraceae bacterium]|nr:RNase adapter RapZ [Ilumatobacteraceae bacterium]
MTDIIVITGLSGAGRSQAADDLEDLGWFVVDNLPVVLIDKVVELSSDKNSAIEKLGLVVGNAHQQTGILDVVGSLRTQGHQVRVLFLEATVKELVQRYEASRRRHPFVEANIGLEDLIEKEKSILQDVRAAADVVIDTTSLTVHQLKSQIMGLFGPASAVDTMQIGVTSFGYKRGLPSDVDLVFDVRFLPNPHWNEQLRPLTGLDDAVKTFVLEQPLTQQFLAQIDALLDLTLPAYLAEGRSYLTIAIGCTGGRHRSVAIAEALGLGLSQRGLHPRIVHRDVSAN